MSEYKLIALSGGRGAVMYAKCDPQYGGSTFLPMSSYNFFGQNFQGLGKESSYTMSFPCLTHALKALMKLGRGLEG